MDGLQCAPAVQLFRLHRHHHAPALALRVHVGVGVADLRDWKDPVDDWTESAVGDADVVNSDIRLGSLRIYPIDGVLRAEPDTDLALGDFD